MGGSPSPQRRTRRNATLATPIALTQLAQIAMMATDLAWIGHIGIEALAAAALAGMILSVGLTFAAGVISAVAPLAAQAHGAANTALVRSALRMGLWIALALWAPTPIAVLFERLPAFPVGKGSGTDHSFRG
ncbi:MATE family efflux transporter [Bradyrhizobium mercantei]|uniref:MATE family efflux transporter n=1 Tax=Bradyrhizobium mercantei TaxID=1904807 RepID=UPI0009784A60